MSTVIKTIYNSMPFKKQIFTFLKTFWKPKESIYKHLHFQGTIKVPIDKSRAFKIMHYGYQIENEVFWAGLTNGWEKESIKLWIKLCQNSESIVDIGANTGIYSLIAKAVNPQANVYAFEPVKRVFKKLQENISLNSYDIKPFEKAVSNKTGTAIIYDPYTSHVYSVTVNKNLSKPEVKVIETRIETITLDYFIKTNNVPKIDLLKIDVETHEPEVMEGFSEYLSKFKPTILIEVLNDEVGQKISSAIKGLGYLYFNIDEKAGIRHVSEICKSDYYNYLLCSKEIATKLAII